MGAAGLNGLGISANVLVTLNWTVVHGHVIVTGSATSVAVIMGKFSLVCHPLLPARHPRNYCGGQEVGDNTPDQCKAKCSSWCCETWTL